MPNYVRAILYIVIVLLSIGAVVGVGAWLASRHYQPTIDKLNEQVTTCGNLRRQADATIFTQNNAITALQIAQLARGKSAKDNVAAAGESAKDDYGKANAVLSESVTGHDVCAAASSAFDVELTRERAK
jgi:hypothetical protein